MSSHHPHRMPPGTTKDWKHLSFNSHPRTSQQQHSYVKRLLTFPEPRFPAAAYTKATWSEQRLSPCCSPLLWSWKASVRVGYNLNNVRFIGKWWCPRWIVSVRSPIPLGKDCLTHKLTEKIKHFKNLHISRIFYVDAAFETLRCA